MKKTHYKYEIVSERIRKMIDTGMLIPGEKLPSLRDMSDKMGLSIATIMKSYIDLESLGIVEARPQSGFYATGLTVPQAPLPEKSSIRIQPTKINKSHLHKSILKAMSSPDIVPLNGAVPSEELLAGKELKKIIKQLLNTPGFELMRYEEPQGSFQLRNQIACHISDYTFKADAEKIIITTGATQALDIVLRTLTHPGDTVLLESPTFFGYLPLLESLGLYALEIPTDFSSGIEIDDLRKAIDAYEVKACILQPDFGNPVSFRYPDKKKSEITALLESRAILLIEDLTYRDLSYDHLHMKCLASFEDSGHVIQVSSFSKTIGPGGVGWIVPGKYYEELLQTKCASAMNTSKLIQNAFAEYLATGHYGRHLKRMSAAFKTQTATYRSHIATYFPQGTCITKPDGGFLLWVELPPSIDTGILYKKILTRNIAFAPGTIFTSQEKYTNCMRINCGYPWSDKMEQAIKIIGDAACDMMGT